MAITTFDTGLKRVGNIAAASNVLVRAPAVSVKSRISFCCSVTCLPMRMIRIVAVLLMLVAPSLYWTVASVYSS